MKNSESTFFLFIGAMIIGILLSMNISFNKNISSPILTAEQYQDSYNKRNKLYNEIENLKEQNKAIRDKIDKYSTYDEFNNRLINDMKKELNINIMLSGIDEAKGQGLKIVMSDGEESFSGEIIDSFLLMYRTIHDDDMINVINELKAAGAEAISINNQRIVYNSEIYCAGQFLRINGVKISAPFYINIIGDPETIESYLLSDDSFMRSLINREIQVDITKNEEVLVPAYIGNVSAKYMSIYKK